MNDDRFLYIDGLCESCLQAINEGKNVVRRTLDKVTDEVMQATKIYFEGEVNREGSIYKSFRANKCVPCGNKWNVIIILKKS